MVVEQQDRYPKGTYRVRITLRLDTANTVSGFHLVNLTSGYQVRSATLWDLIPAIEDDLLANKYPQSSVRYRSWGEGPTPLAQRLPAAPPDKNAPGKELTFVVRVLFRQNATWQGTVQWLEGMQTRQYRSVNELMRLIGEAVEMTGCGNAAEPEAKKRNQ